MRRHAAISVLFLLLAQLSSAREEISLCGSWEMRPMTMNQSTMPYDKVEVPSTWNVEYIPGTLQYNRETMVYRRSFTLGDTCLKREFLYFEGVNSYCDVFVNHKLAGFHKGGYTAFCLEVSDLVHEGENELELWVSNAFRSDILPLIGDFNIYGGIHRPCRLIVTGKECIRPDFHASDGVLVEQKSVDATRAAFCVKTLVSADSFAGLELRTSIYSPEGDKVAVKVSDAAENTAMDFEIASPRLWNGRQDPALYKFVVELLKDGTVVDSKCVRSGFRSLSADPQTGILLNGKHYPVHGFARHEDFAGRGSALLPEDYRTDLGLILEAGATAVRLAHYPHPEIMYELADSSGLLVWTEIPFCGPGGWDYAGYIGTEAFKETARENLRELVYQKFNHPSVCFWGIFNEVLYTDGVRFVDYGNPVGFIRELNAMYKSLDPSRLTTFATCEDETPFLGCSDLVAWNKYLGWYEEIDGAADFYDSRIRNCGDIPFGVSEYGAGASVNHHAAGVLSSDPVEPSFHPEEKQSAVHEDTWAIFRDRPQIWGTFVWNFADFRSAGRMEGDTPGINDKGLVTYDRKVRKDAWWFYRTQWNPEPVVYITSRRFTDRTDPVTDVKVYTNLKSATLYVGGKKVSKADADSLGRVIWKNVPLSQGENEIKVVSGKGKNTLTDSCVWTLR